MKSLCKHLIIVILLSSCSQNDLLTEGKVIGVKYSESGDYVDKELIVQFNFQEKQYIRSFNKESIFIYPFFIDDKIVLKSNTGLIEDFDILPADSNDLKIIPQHNLGLSAGAIAIENKAIYENCNANNYNLLEKDSSFSGFIGFDGYQVEIIYRNSKDSNLSFPIDVVEFDYARNRKIYFCNKDDKLYQVTMPLNDSGEINLYFECFTTIYNKP